MFNFKDFTPQLKKKTLNSKLGGEPHQVEDLHELVARASAWAVKEQLRVINVETIMVPKLPLELGTDFAQGGTENPASSSFLYQVVRVWYATDFETPTAYTGATRRLETP